MIESGRRQRLLQVATLVLLLVPGTGWAEEDCLPGSAGGTPVWFSLDLGGGMTFPLPLEGDSNTKVMGTAFVAGVNLHLGHRFAVGLSYVRKDFDGEFSLLQFVNQDSILARGYVAAIASEFVEWRFFVEVGMSHYMKRWEAPVFEGGYPVDFVPKETTVWTVAVGGGTRFLVFPVQFIGLYLEVGADYSHHADIGLSEGAGAVKVLLGTEGHF